MDNHFTLESSDDTLDLELNLMEEEEMQLTKFYNFQCIYLYACLDYAIAQALTQSAQLHQTINHLIPTPIELYESPYMAELFSPTSKNRILTAFAVYVQDNIYDELDLELNNRIKRSGKNINEIKRNIAVIRQLKTYKETQNSKSKPYVSYIIQNQKAIKSVTPIII